VRKFVTLALLFCFGIMLSQAQDQKQKSPSDKWEIFGGYTFQRDYGMYNAFSFKGSSSSDAFAPFNANGGQAAASYFPLRHFGLTYQMTFAGSGDRKINSTSDTQRIGTQSYLVGPAFRYAFKGGRLGKTSLFAHELFGVTHNAFNASSDNYAFCDDANGDPVLSCSTNNFTLATGGGIDYRISRHVSIRPAQVEYWTEQIPEKDFNSYYSAESVKFGVNGLRYSAGAVVNF